MNAISTVLSSVGSFSDSTKQQYSSMLALANEVLRQVNDMLSFVQGEKSKVERQMIQLKKIEEDISTKTIAYYIEMESAYREYQYYSDQYYSADEDMEDYYRDKADAAHSVYYRWSEKHSHSQSVQNSVEEKSAQVKQLGNAISAVSNALERNSFEIRKYISLIEDEASYNVQSLLALVESIQNYVTSKEIFSTYAIERVSDSSSASSYVSIGSKKASDNSSSTDKSAAKTKLKYRIKSAQTIEQYLTRNGQEKPIYRRFNVYAPPVKAMILQATMRMGPSFQQFILKQLEGVVFLNAQHGFTYSATNKNGTMIRIIGVNLTDPAFSRNLLKHVAHHIYIVNCTREAVTMNNFASREAQSHIHHANARIQNLSRELMTNSPNPRRRNVIKPTSGSKFFASCFQAYVNQDREFLNAVKESYGESYKVFSEIMKKMPQD